MNRIIFVVSVLSLWGCNSPKDTNVQQIKTSSVEESVPVSVVSEKSVTKTHYPNGNVKFTGETIGGKREGNWVYYYESGNKQSENEYVKGVLNGKSVTYYPNGQVRYLGYFKNGKKDGLWEYYSENGDLIQSTTFLKGKKVTPKP